MAAEGTTAWESLKNATERAKKKLSTSPRADIHVLSFEVKGGDTVDLDVEITQSEFEGLIEPLIDRSLEKIEGCLKKAGVKKESIERLLLVGGTCYIPRVRSAVEGLFGLKAETGVDPDLAVSLGAAISAGLKTGNLDSSSTPIVQDVATYRMGTSCLTPVGGQIKRVFSELMPANAAVPFFSKERFTLLTTEQDVVLIDVLQGNDKTFYAEDAIPTGAIGEIVDIPPSTTGEPRSIDIELRYDESHVIRVTAKMVGIDRSLTLVLHADQIGDDPLKAMGAGSVVSDLWEKSPLATKNASLIKRAEVVLQGKPNNGEHIEAALIELKDAVARNSQDSAQEARERLVDLLSD